MPLYFNFLDTYEAIDVKTDVEVQDILEFLTNTGNKYGYPIYSGTDLFGTPGNYPLSTVAETETFAMLGLTTDAKLEEVIFDPELYDDAKQYYTNQSMLRKVTGREHRVHLTHDRAYMYRSFNYTSPTVKRANEYMSCWILIWLDARNTKHQFPNTNATDIAHVDFQVEVRYDEWNPHFDQTDF